MNNDYDPAGFVCPDWAQGRWNSKESTIELCIDGKWAVVDHSLQTTVYTGMYKDCEAFLRIEG